jgi:hypothetical protein
MQNSNSLTSAALASFYIGGIGAWYLPVAILAGIAGYLATRPKLASRELTDAERNLLARIAEIEAMPGFGLTGVSLPWPIYSEHKRLLRQRDAIAL